MAEEKIVHGLPIRFLNRENPDPALRPKSLACPYPESNFRGNSSSGQFEPNLDSALSCFHPHRVHRSIQTFWHTYQRLEYQLSEGKPKGVYFVHCINKQAENGICCLKDFPPQTMTNLVYDPHITQSLQIVTILGANKCYKKMSPDSIWISIGHLLLPLSQPK